MSIYPSRFQFAMSEALSTESTSGSTMEEVGKPRRRLAPQAPSHLVRSLCQAVFVAELLDPKGELWMFLRQLWNVPVIDNRANSFRHLEPNWPQAEVRLLSVLEKMMDEDTAVHILTEDDPRNETFANEFRGLQQGSNTGRIRTVEQWKGRPEGIVAPSFYLRGGLQLSRRGGVSVAGRSLMMYTDDEAITEGLRVFRTRWPAE